MYIFITFVFANINGEQMMSYPLALIFILIRAQRIMVIKVKDIGKIPHSRIPVQQWQKSTTFPAPPSQASLATHSISGTTRR